MYSDAQFNVGPSSHLNLLSAPTSRVHILVVRTVHIILYLFIAFHHYAVYSCASIKIKLFSYAAWESLFSIYISTLN